MIYEYRVCLICFKHEYTLQYLNILYTINKKYIATSILKHNTRTNTNVLTSHEWIAVKRHLAHNPLRHNPSRQ